MALFARWNCTVGRDGDGYSTLHNFQKAMIAKIFKFSAKKIKDGDAWFFKTFHNFLLI